MGFCLCVYLFVALTAGFSEIYVMKKKKKKSTTVILTSHHVYESTLVLTEVSLSARRRVVFCGS